MNGRSAHERAVFGEAVLPGGSNGPNLPTKSLPSVTLRPQSTPDIMQRTLDFSATRACTHKSAMSALPPIVLQKSFFTGAQKFCGLQARPSCKDVRGLIRLTLNS